MSKQNKAGFYASVFSQLHIDSYTLCYTTLSLRFVSKFYSLPSASCQVISLSGGRQTETVGQGEERRDYFYLFFFSVLINITQQWLFPWHLRQASVSFEAVRFIEFSQGYSHCWAVFLLQKSKSRYVKIPLNSQVLRAPSKLFSLYLQAQDYQLLPVIITFYLNVLGFFLIVLLFNFSVTNFLC